MAHSYVLEHADESDRLEQQARLDAYNLDREIAGISLAPGGKLIDLGCGSGLLSRSLAQRFPLAQIDGCDGSEQRLEQARALLGNGEKVDFFLSPLEAITADADRYDWAIARYVFEHLADPVACAREALRILKPGGKLLVVDFDGLMFNLFPVSPALAEMRATLIRNVPVNFYIGRELPSILLRAGFMDVRWTVEAHSFQGDQLAAERDIAKQRIRQAWPVLVKTLGQDGAAAFEQDYLAHITAPEAVLFYNKFKVVATKPA